MSNQTSDWLSIREAAAVLGVSDLTIRRRIKDGRLAHRLVDGKYYVNLTQAVSSPRRREKGHESGSDQSGLDYEVISQATDHTRDDRSPGLLTDHAGLAAVPPIRVDLDALLSDHRRLAEQAGRASALEGQLRELSRRHRELEELTLTLSNRNGWLESKLEERERHIKLLTDNTKNRGRPWWKRVFRPAVAEA